MMKWQEETVTVTMLLVGRMEKQQEEGKKSDRFMSGLHQIELRQQTLKAIHIFPSFSISLIEKRQDDASFRLGTTSTTENIATINEQSKEQKDKTRQG